MQCAKRDEPEASMLCAILFSPQLGIPVFFVTAIAYSPPVIWTLRTEANAATSFPEGGHAEESSKAWHDWSGDKKNAGKRPEQRRRTYALSSPAATARRPHQPLGDRDPFALAPGDPCQRRHHIGVSLSKQV
jgi:hypothetical protein